MCCTLVSRAETQLTLSPSLLYFDYTEFSTSNETLDNELGWLPGIELKLNQQITNAWQFSLSSEYYQGNVDYTGQTQTGIPHTTNTDTQFFRLAGNIERNIYEQLNVFAGVQFHQWNRDIKDNNNVSGVDETYKWQEYAIGLNTDFSFYKNHIFNVSAAYLLIRNGTIDVDLSRINFGSTTLNLGDATGSRFTLSWSQINTNQINYGASLFIEAWEFGRSNTAATQGGARSAFVTEPRSETINIGLKLNVHYYF